VLIFLAFFALVLIGQFAHLAQVWPVS